jgi:hypothetical protein
MRTAEFKLLDARTRHVRKLTLDAMCLEPISPVDSRTFNDLPLSKISAEDIEVLRDRKIHTPEAANGRVKAARQVCKFGAKKGKYLKSNIARDVEYFRTGSTGFHTWTVEEVEQFQERHRFPAGCRKHVLARAALGPLRHAGHLGKQAALARPAVSRGLGGSGFL